MAFLKSVLSVTVPPIAILDVGASDLTKDRYQSLVDQKLAKVTGFEPDPAEFEKLKTRGGPYRYHPVFLGSGGEATFHRTRFPGCSSLLRPDPAVIDRFVTIGAGRSSGNFFVEEEIPVQTTRLDEVRDLEPPDFIKLDTQGSELAILEGGQAVLRTVLVAEIEVEFLPLYQGQPLIGDIHCFMRDRGFVLHKLIDMAGRGLAPIQNPSSPRLPVSQVLWADAIFVRDYFDLQPWSYKELIKAATILHDVYRSFDLVHHLLAEIDRRSNKGLADRYRAHLEGGALSEAEFLTVKA